MDKLKKLSQELFQHLGVTPKAIKINQDKEAVSLDIDLPDQEAGILIGYHGETIAALQLLLNMMLYKQTGEWVKLVVNIGDYREKRTDYLTFLAQETAVKVVESGEPLALYNLNPFERRIVHMALGEKKEVMTESQGEGKNRFLVVSPAAAAGPAK
ncbi:MAG: KH domain-containing protein [Patescibacteria group bacterium]|nr:KH domain-containing protein [Patescibacteria group bacterium]MDP4030999.1 KH domain-containing protein [Candidatus Beckwithbacteria bacterium]MDZ4228660.1 KH domain-containing protein [Patescibacteria group bacterium]